MRHSRAELNERLKPYGLHVAYYNPGDNPGYKVVPLSEDYFGASSARWPRYGTLAEVSAFADGLDLPMAQFRVGEVGR